MQIQIKRFEFGDNYTIGRLYINDIFECYTLEDKVRPSTETKVPGQTAIPEGTYKVIIDYSNRFKRDLPHILNVANFSGVRIHSGNTDKDTEGCILLGMSWNGGNFVGNSRIAFNSFFKKLEEDLVKNAAVLTIN